MPAPALVETNLPFPKRSGKVRDVYDLDDVLLIIATDRISAFDCIMPNGIPDKGRILTSMSLFWFEFLKDVPNHLIATRVKDYPAQVHPYADQLEGRSMLVKKAKVIPIECVARGYLAGSGWKEYQAGKGVVGGVQLSPGLRQCAHLPTPMFTPATKEESGHDINIDEQQMAQRIGPRLTQQLRELTLHMYQQAANYARLRDIIIADTKFEFGQLPDGQIIVIDEVLTPDSSRFWPLSDYKPGRDQPSYDKQYVRDYLNGLTWNKAPPAPPLPDEVVQGTRQRYIEAYERLTERTWA